MNEKNTGRDCGCNADIPAEDAGDPLAAPEQGSGSTEQIGAQPDGGPGAESRRQFPTQHGGSLREGVAAAGPVKTELLHAVEGRELRQHGADRIGRLLYGVDPRRPQPEDPVAVAENPLALGRTAVCNGLHTYKGKKIIRSLHPGLFGYGPTATAGRAVRGTSAGARSGHRRSPRACRCGSGCGRRRQPPYRGRRSPSRAGPRSGWPPCARRSFRP